MTLFSFLSTAGLALLSGGIFLTANALLLAAVELLVKAWRRTFRSWTGARLRDMGVVQEAHGPSTPSLDWKRLGLLAAIPAAALSARDAMLSPLVFLIGTSILLWTGFQKRQAERAQVNEDAESVALQLRALMGTGHSLVNALSRVKLPDGLLKRALGEVTRRLVMHQPPEQAAQALGRLPGPVTARLSALIAHSARLSGSVQDSLFLALEQEAHRQKLLRTKSRQTLSLVRGTIRLLQAVAAGATGFVMLSPIWRAFFLQDISHRVLLTVLICAAALGSLYFEYEVYQLTYGETAA